MCDGTTPSTIPAELGTGRSWSRSYCEHGDLPFIVPIHCRTFPCAGCTSYTPPCKPSTTFSQDPIPSPLLEFACLAPVLSLATRRGGTSAIQTKGRQGKWITKLACQTLHPTLHPGSGVLLAPVSLCLQKWHRRCKDRALERSTGLPGVSLASPNKFGARSQLMAALYLLD